MRHVVAVMTLLILVCTNLAGPPSATAQAPLGCEVAAADLEISPAEQLVLTAINGYRAERGLPGFELSPALTRAAVWKASAIAGGAPRAHDDAGRAWHIRLNDCGYHFIAAKGENLGQLDLESRAAGDPPATVEAAAIINAWQSSPSHEPQLSNPAFRVAGIARVRSGSVISWATTFGSVPDDRGITPARLAGVQLPGPEIDPCLPDGCKGEQLALWRGDAEAWRPRLEADGQQLVDAAVLLRTLYYRREQGSGPSAALLAELGLDR